MIRPSQQWAIQIDITNACHLHCSNCTRLLDHVKKRYFMDLDCFRRAIRAVKGFVTESEPCPTNSNNRGRRKVIGIIGGEPLLHPQFPELVDIMLEELPEPRYRGLWTSKDWMTGTHPKWGDYRPQVERLIGANPTHDASGPSTKHRDGYINWNMHLPDMNVHHQPLLVASQDVVPDERRRWELIEDCWVQREWSSTVTPKGFFFCEVAGHFDMIFDGPGGLPLEPGVWQGELAFVRNENGIPQPQGKFAEQIERSCTRCGACVPLPARRDAENRDDVSRSNLEQLLQIQSPRVKKGDYVLQEFDPDKPYDPNQFNDGWVPFKYVKGARHQDQSRVARGLDDAPVSAHRRD